MSGGHNRVLQRDLKTFTSVDGLQRRNSFSNKTEHGFAVQSGHQFIPVGTPQLDFKFKRKKLHKVDNKKSWHTDYVRSGRYKEEDNDIFVPKIARKKGDVVKALMVVSVTSPRKHVAHNNASAKIIFDKVSDSSQRMKSVKAGASFWKQTGLNVEQSLAEKEKKNQQIKALEARLKSRSESGTTSKDSSRKNSLLSPRSRATSRTSIASSGSGANPYAYTPRPPKKTVAEIMLPRLNFIGIAPPPFPAIHEKDSHNTKSKSARKSHATPKPLSLSRTRSQGRNDEDEQSDHTRRKSHSLEAKADAAVFEIMSRGMDEAPPYNPKAGSQSARRAPVKEPPRIPSPTTFWNLYGEAVQAHAIQLKAVDEAGYFSSDNLTRGGPQKPRPQVFREVHVSQQVDAEHAPDPNDYGNTDDFASHVIAQSDIAMDPVARLAREYADFDLAKKDLDHRLHESLSHMESMRTETLGQKFFDFEPHFKTLNADVTAMRTGAESIRKRDILRKYEKVAWYYAFIDQIRSSGYAKNAPTPQAMQVISIVQSHMEKPISQGVRGVDIEAKKFDMNRVRGLQDIHGNTKLVTNILRSIDSTLMDAHGVPDLLVVLQRVFRISSEQYYRCLKDAGHAKHAKIVKDGGVAKLSTSYGEAPDTVAAMPVRRGKKKRTAKGSYKSSRLGQYSSFGAKAPLITPMEEYEGKLSQFRYEFAGGQGTVVFANKHIDHTSKHVKTTLAEREEAQDRFGRRVGPNKPRNQKRKSKQRTSFVRVSSRRLSRDRGDSISSTGSRLSISSRHSSGDSTMGNDFNNYDNSGHGKKGYFVPMMLHQEVFHTNEPQTKQHIRTNSGNMYSENGHIVVDLPETDGGNLEQLIEQALKRLNV